MKTKQILKIAVDLLMTATLPLLMAYSLVYGSDPTVGETVHEWLGVGMFALLVLHHILNRKWSRSVLRGRYTPYRVLQTVLALLVLLSMCGSTVSGVLLSRYVFRLDIHRFNAVLRTVHLLSAYWGLVFLSLHLGLHLNTMISMAGRIFSQKSPVRAWIVRLLGWAVAGYGFYAFLKRDFPDYMFLQIHFVFFDFDEGLIWYLLDYLAVMGFFVCVGHYLALWLKRLTNRRQMGEPS